MRTEQRIDEVVPNWSSARRKLIGSLLVGLLASHLSYVPLNLVGLWTTNWTQFGSNGLMSAILAITCACSLTARRWWMPFVVLATLLSVLLYLMQEWNDGRHSWVVWTYQSLAVSLGFALTVALRRHLNAFGN